MKQQLHNKLRSRSGASISIALLLFLICVVVGGVVLAAATSAGGRASKMAEMDQRYYSVTSAAKLLAGELNGKTVTIERSKVTEKKTVSTYAFDVTEGDKIDHDATSSNTNTETTYTTTINKRTDTNGNVISDKEYQTVVTDTPSTGDQITLTDSSFLTTLAVNLLFGTENCNTDAAWARSMSAGVGLATPVSFTLEAVPSTDLSYLKVVGTYQLQSDGTLLIELKDSGAKDNYTLRLVMSPSISETESTSTNSASSWNLDTYTETETTTTTAVKTAEIGWTVSSVEKVVSAPSSGTGGGSGNGG